MNYSYELIYEKTRFGFIVIEFSKGEPQNSWSSREIKDWRDFWGNVNRSESAEGESLQRTLKWLNINHPELII